MDSLRTRLLAVVVACFCLATASSASASRGQISLFEAPRELMSDNASLRAQTLDQIQGFGVSWVRLVLWWRSVAPNPGSASVPSFDETDPNTYPGLWRYDRIIDELHARGMHVLLTISGPVPKWATSTRRDYVTKPNLTHWQRFVTAIGRRYGDRVDTWSIWNEPNLIKFLAPQYTRSGRPYSPTLYRKLFLAAHQALVATGNGGDTILMGETEPRGGSKAVAPLAFLRGALCLSRSYRKARGCATLPADGYAHHAYTPASGPWFRPPEGDDVTIGVLGRLTHALDLAARAHAIKAHMPVYLTEFGIQSYPDPYFGVSLTRQAEYRSIAERIAYLNPRVRMLSQYLMRDDNPRPGNSYARYSGFESGLRTASGKPKPAYAAYRTPLVVHLTSSGRVVFWGLVRPHVGRTRVSLQVRRAGAKRWSPLFATTTDPSGYWTHGGRYRSHAWYRVVWVGPSGAVYNGPPTRTY